MKAAGTKPEAARDAQNKPARKEPFSFADGLCLVMCCAFLFIEGL